MNCMTKSVDARGSYIPSITSDFNSYSNIIIVVHGVGKKGPMLTMNSCAINHPVENAQETSLFLGRFLIMKYA